MRDRIEVKTILFRDSLQFWEKNSEIRDRIEVKTFLLFSLSLWPEEVQKNLHTAPCSKSLEFTGLNSPFSSKIDSEN